MHLPRGVMPLFRLILMGMFALLTVLLTLSIPGGFKYAWQHDQPRDVMLLPLTALAMVWVVALQVCVVVVWKLLRSIDADSIFTLRSLGWFTVAVRALTVGVASLAGIFVLVVSRADDPGAPMLLLLANGGMALVWMAAIVSRALLMRAIELEDSLRTRTPD